MKNLDVTFWNKNIFGYYHGTQNTSKAPCNCNTNMTTIHVCCYFMRHEHSLGTIMVPKNFTFEKFAFQAFYSRVTWIYSVSETKRSANENAINFKRQCFFRKLKSIKYHLEWAIEFNMYFYFFWSQIRYRFMWHGYKKLEMQTFRR